MDIDSFANRIQLLDNGCWQWLGAKAGLYSQMRIGGKMHYGHRWSYEYFKGPIPHGLQLDHLCRNTLCVNPQHLEAVTARINLLRGFGFAGNHARKTHCPKGHPYSGDNLGISKDNERYCKECKRQQQRRLHEQKVRQNEGGKVIPCCG